MKAALLLATLSLRIFVPAYAYETTTGAVMICDTQKQVERYVQLFDGDPQVAIHTVNTEENNPNACALVDVSYVEGPEVGMARSTSYAFRIVPIAVVGVNTSRGYGPVKPALFFMPIKIDELAASLFDRYARLDILVGNAAEFGTFIDDETRKWSELIREAGLKGE